MAIEMRLDLKLAQKLVMTPQLQQAIKLLQLSRLEMSQLVYQEMIENPVLEEDMDMDEAELGPRADELDRDVEDVGNADQAIDVFDMKWDNYIEEEDSGGYDYSYYSDSEDEKPSYEQTLTTPPSLSDYLTWQLRLMTVPEKVRDICELIIGNIDEDGYLRDLTLAELAQSAGTTIEDAEKALSVVQEMDPPGVGARDLKECLLVQARLSGFGGSVVEEIILNHMDDLEKRRYPVIGRKLNITVKEVQLAAKAVESFEPKPGRPFTSSEVQYIIPDVFVVKKDGEFVILLNDEGMPKLRVSQFYKNLMRKGGDTEARDYIEGKLRSAHWLIRSIEQRNKTIYKVTESIIRRQRDFFDKGMGHIRPMILKDVADDIGMHESTISRVTTNKYMHTPQGIFELKFFFSGGLASIEGDDSLSSITVRNLIHKTISEEDPGKPINDREIVSILKARNIDIARRTVAKYRGELKIPPASMRKKSY